MNLRGLERRLDKLEGRTIPPPLTIWSIIDAVCNPNVKDDDIDPELLARLLAEFPSEPVPDRIELQLAKLAQSLPDNPGRVSNEP